MVDILLGMEEGTRLYLLAPVVRGRKGEYRKELAEYHRKGSAVFALTAKYMILMTPTLIRSGNTISSLLSTDW